MKKILDIIIIVLLTTLVMNFFFSKPQEPVKNTLLVESKVSAYTIPASVVLTLTNTQNSDVLVHPCEDIHVVYAWETINFSNKASLCTEVTVKAWGKQDIMYLEAYQDFLKAGKYVFQVKIDGKEYISPFEIENPGTIRKLFTTLFYAPIYNLLISLTLVFHYSLGMGILMVTIILRILLIWPQHRMMLSQKKLQTIQPKIKAIQEEYKGQQQMLWMKLLELYKKENVNPMASFWLLFLQMPILIVIYRIIFSITDPSNYYYIYEMFSHFDLTLLKHNFLGLDLLKAGGVGGMILALLVGGVQFLQVKLSLNKQKNDQKGVILEKKQWKEGYQQMMPDPDMMNKVMLYGMPIMVTVFTYTLFSWIGLYWLISTLFMILQQLFVNRVLKK